MPKEMKILIPTTRIEKSVKCENTQQAYKIFREMLNYEHYELKNQEHFWIMGVDAIGYVSCIYIAAIGAENRMIIDPVDIFSTAVIHKSKKVFLAHNHPYEGIDTDLSLMLSPEDFDFTNRLYHACLFFGIEVMDHIILSDETYYSLGENKYMTLIHENSKYKTYEVLKPRLDADKADAVDRGKQEGLLEGKIEMAKKLLKRNIDIDIILETTELTLKEIKKINTDRCSLQDADATE